MTRCTPQLSAEHIAHRDRVLNGAVLAGKITAGHLDQYREMYDRDPVGTQQLVAQLAASADTANLDHTSGAPTRTAANAGADDSVLRAAQQAQTPMDGQAKLVPDPNGGYMTEAQAAAHAETQRLLGSYDQTPGTQTPPTGPITPATD